MKSLFLLAMLVLFSTRVFAGTYQTELNLGFDHEDMDGSDLDTTSLGWRIYFDQVSAQKGPLAEAAFLDRASGMKFDFSGVKQKD